MKQKALIAARKRALLLAIETLRRRAQALADEALDADNDDAEIPGVIVSDPPASFMLSLPESAAAAAAFSDDLKTVQAALGLSAQEVQQLKSEHSAYARS